MGIYMWIIRCLVLLSFIISLLTSFYNFLFNSRKMKIIRGLWDKTFSSAGITRIRFEGVISAQMVGHPLTYSL